MGKQALHRAAAVQFSPSDNTVLYKSSHSYGWLCTALQNLLMTLTQIM
jgi:hypothetical protein